MSTSDASVGRSGYRATGGDARRSMSGLVYSGGIMIHRFLLCIFLFSLVVSLASSAQPEQSSYDDTGESWSWGFGSEEGGGGSSYLGVDIADVSPERLGELKLKEEYRAEVTMT